jgi:hypothetical protein
MLVNVASRGLRALAGLGLVLSFAAQTVPAGAQAGFTDPAFQRTWERTDKPVADGTANRSWYWGPGPGFSTMEPNKSSPGGMRLVQYFDKSRMEINNPGGNKNDAFYVTNGLLATELMTGRMQVGDTDFEQRCAAAIPLASDTDDANAPTYATFGKLMAQPKSNQVGQKATAVVDKAGNLSADASKVSVPNTDLVYFEPITGRNIPKVFWDFLNASGPIYVNGQMTTGPLNQPWFFASGLPVTEAYWARVKIAGQPADVLIQAFERRVLTYIPSYKAPFDVQMGNVGQHYYGWRYKNVGCAPAPPTPPAGTPTPPPAASCDKGMPANTAGSVTPACGPVGTVFMIHITGFTPDEKISLWITAPTGQVLGTPRPLDVGHHPADLDDVFDSSILPLLLPKPDGLWAITYQGEKSGHQSIVWFKIVPESAAPPTATPVPGGGPPAACDRSANKDATVTPTSGPKGTVFSITITGFQPNEDASYWLTDPDGAVFGTEQTLHIPSSGSGTLQFNSGVLYPGTWSLTVHGLTSNHESIAVFCVGP